MLNWIKVFIIGAINALIYFGYYVSILLFYISCILFVYIVIQGIRYRFLNYRANKLQKLGRYDGAIPIAQQSVKLAQQISGKTYYAKSQNALEAMLNILGKLYRISEKLLLFGKKNNYRAVTVAINNLAELYRLTGQYNKAEPLFKQAIEIDKIALPETYPDLAHKINNLALLYSAQGRYKEAELLFKEALEIYKIALPENNPYLAHPLGGIAYLYRTQKQYNEAEALLKQALEIKKIALPKNHPSLATTLNNIALLDLSRNKT
ncbi:tetratricopeptide repeat protein [Okeania sp. SIO1I7]|uniref:tetratricopeptide repeat protein n=1 Tax=Okeania sp. SIO1I7 TaxID=2607772 RepID=UPI0013FB8914|nr:tetratricopeptide repeat protein [Okeania sp. SIO1I7]NET29737.1 tetratricopeptide repeat protein [Okeania sp. SIO1I7]